MSYTHHRASGAAPTQSLRSGPSLAKLWMDASLRRDVNRLVATLKPDVIVAHHVEAAVACQGLRMPSAYVAHTELATELSTYTPAGLESVGSRAGRALDRLALRIHNANAAIAPRLATRLRDQHKRPVRYLPLPWPIAEGASSTKVDARRHYDIPVDARVVAYVGNLDRYQGVSGLIDAMTRIATHDPSLRVLIATASDSVALVANLRGSVLDGRVHFVALADESTRSRVHAAADVIAVPRAVEGGVPIKLLDALARDRPVVTVERATAGLNLYDVCTVCRDDDPGDLAETTSALLHALPDRRESARAYLKREHSDDVFLAAFDALCADAVTTTDAPPHRSHRREA